MKKKKLSAAVRAKISAAVKKAAKLRKNKIGGTPADYAPVDLSVQRRSLVFNKTRLLGSPVDPNVEMPENAGQQVDMVNHPPHYKSVPGVECIQVARYFGFCRGNAIKYLWRAGQKGNLIEDLEKAIWYIQDEINQLKKRQAEIQASQTIYTVEFKKAKNGKKGKWEIDGSLASKVKDGAK